jgi:hypothetical protein
VDKGLSINLPVSGTAQANLHVHGDPSIGGGVGTSIGVNGGGSGAGAGSINFVHAVLDGAPVLAAVADYECRDITVEARTDGKFKIDWGWAKVPTVGFRQKFLIDLSSVKPTVLLDALPLPIAGRDKNGKPFVVEEGDRKVVVEPTWQALAVSVALRSRRCNEGEGIGARGQRGNAAPDLDRRHQISHSSCRRRRCAAAHGRR